MNIALNRNSEEDISSVFISNTLWGVAAIVSACNTEISNDFTGISVTIEVWDVLLMLVITYLLSKGLKTSNYLLVLPWIVLSTWNMYNGHYSNLLKMGNVLQQANTVEKLPWIALLVDLLGLTMRLVLITRVAHLALKQWADRRLEDILRKK